MKKAVVLAVACLLAGCATTKIQSTGMALQQPLCQAGSPSVSISVLWSPQWRSDQKEPPLREAAALRGIEQYFKSQPCISTLTIHRIVLPEKYEQLTEAQIIAMARTEGDTPDNVILLVVRELGPKLIIGIPTLIEGGTEVVLETRVTHQQSATSMANIRTHWQKGGPFYIKGVKTLDLDMQTVLGAIFSAPLESE